VTRRVAALGLLRSCHPEPSAAVTAFAVALSIAVGRSAAGVVLAGSAVAAGQLSVGWHNDWLDAERDEASVRPDKPVAQGTVPRQLVRRAAGMAVAAVIPLSLACGWRAGSAHLAAVALAWGYNWRWKATVWSWVPYAGAFALLAAFVTLGLPVPRWPPWWALVAAATLGVGAHLANAAPDLAQDLAGGIRGLPHVLGYRRSVVAATALLLVASLLIAFGAGRPGVASAVGLAAVVATAACGLVWGRREGSRLLFRVAMVIAAVDVGMLVARGHALVA